MVCVSYPSLIFSLRVVSLSWAYPAPQSARRLRFCVASASLPLDSKYVAFAEFFARILHKSAALAHGSQVALMLSMSQTQKRQLALCLRNTVVGMTLSFILWQAWDAANDLSSE